MSEFSTLNKSEISHDANSLRRKHTDFDKAEENANELGNLPKRKMQAKHVPKAVRGK